MNIAHALSEFIRVWEDRPVNHPPAQFPLECSPKSDTRGMRV